MERQAKSPTDRSASRHRASRKAPGHEASHLAAESDPLPAFPRPLDVQQAPWPRGGGTVPVEVVLALQSTVGNWAVQRHLQDEATPRRAETGRLAALDGRPLGNARDGAPIQRADPDLPEEFIPTITPKPKRATVKIGDEHLQSFTVTNAKEAPAGTAYSWGGSLGGRLAALLATDPSLFELVGAETRDGGRARRLQVRAEAPGATEFQDILTHQVPGGPQVVTGSPAVPVTVPSPAIKQVSAVRLSAPTGVPFPDTDRLQVGDELFVRFELANLSKTNTDFSTTSVIEGEGVNSALAVVDAELTAPGVYDVRFKAKKVGPAVPTIRVIPAAMPEADAPTTTLETHVEMGKEEFEAACAITNTVIDLAERKATAWLASIASAYKIAWTNHTDVLKDAARAERIIPETILGAALAFAPGGAGGVVAATMKRGGAGAFMIDGVKDLTKWGLRKTGKDAATAAIGAATGAGLTAFPLDPELWQDEMVERVHTELAVATETLLEWQEKARTGDPDFYLDFDPYKAMKETLTVSDVAGNKYKAIGLEPEDEAELADRYEKGFWQTWLETYAYEVITLTSVAPLGAAYHAETVYDVPRAVEKRCEELELPIDDYVEESRRRAKAEADEFNRARGGEPLWSWGE